MKKDTWLVQRLIRPSEGRWADLAGAFSFGGGLRNGGLTNEARQALRQAFEFDYMGAAEFEWGAVPQALQGIYDRRKKFRACTFDLNGHPIHLICHRGDVNEVIERVTSWVKPWGERPHLKEQPRLDRVLDGDEYAQRIGGWLELDNGWFAFTDEQMWRTTAALFDVKSKTEAEVER